MEGYIDIHSHILPELDDGSQSMEQTIHMLEQAYEEGIRSIIATPHSHEGRSMNAISQLEECYLRVKEMIEDKMPDMKLYLGSEIYYSHESVRLLNERQIPTIADTKYILVEFSPMAEYRYVKNALQDFILEGYYPIVAHMERYHHITRNLDLVKEFIDMGAYIQVNAMSITGEIGKEYQVISRKLLKNHFVHMVATDCHSDRNRSPKLKKCIDYLRKKYDEDYVNELLIHNASKILKNQYI